MDDAVTDNEHFKHLAEEYLREEEILKYCGNHDQYYCDDHLELSDSFFAKARTERSKRSSGRIEWAGDLSAGQFIEVLRSAFELNSFYQCTPCDNWEHA